MPFDDTSFLKKSVDVLSFFNEEQLRRITPDIERASYKSGQTILLRGQISNGFYIVKKGKVAASYKGKAGNVQVELKPGDFFGELSLIEDATNDASIKATEDDTEVMTIPSESFRKLLEMQPLLKQTLFQKVNERRKAIQ
ncbi:MAG: cyclic nucleotide-binding domain-containing protein [Elusimicrobia bacterium]|nr:cyclic nucleotide-binding domain-containing protein [Elusimicrobiota bacterium]